MCRRRGSGHSFDLRDFFDSMIRINTFDMAMGTEWACLQYLLAKFGIKISNPFRTTDFISMRIKRDSVLKALGTVVRDIVLKAHNGSCTVRSFNISLRINRCCWCKS